MRAFAFLSLAAVAFAAPLIAPAGVANVVAPVNGVVNAAVGAATKVIANADVSAANANVAYNNIGNNVGNGNNVDVLRRSVTVKNVGLNDSPVYADASDAHVNAITHTVHTRSPVVDVVAVLTAIVKGLVELCTNVGVDAQAAIGNLGINYNNILNDSLNNNNVQVAKRAAVNVVGEILAAIFACVKAALNAGVTAEVLVANIQASCNQIANNVGNGNNVAIASRSLVNAVAPIAVVVNALVVAVTNVCAGLTLQVLNVALTQNNIATNVLNGNTIKILS